MPSMQVLLDRAALSDVFNDYAAAIDLRDWDLLRSCFTDDLEADFTSLMPNSRGQGGDQWADAVRRSIEALTATQHIITNHTHEIDGDISKSRSYLQAQHVLADGEGKPEIHYMIGGYYLYDMVRAGDGWKIKRYSLTVTWRTGNPDIFRLGAQRMKGHQ